MTREEESEDAGPWTEAKWERFMRRSDVRSARYGELFETLENDPDRDTTIAREMGWKVNPLLEFEIVPADEEARDAIRVSEAALKEIAAYSKGMEWMLTVGAALKPRPGDNDGCAVEPDDPISEARNNSLIVPLRIAGGHAMGYDDEMLCGNIVCCRQALEAIERSVGAMKTALAENRLPRDTLSPLIASGEIVRQLIDERVRELRQRVWWD